MKKLTFVVCLFAAAVSFAAIPQSIVLESGNVRVRLDGRKFWNMNKIEWKNRLFGIDEAGAHYGITYQPQGSKFFIGSGHNESGTTEKLVSLEIFADGKKVTPAEKVVIKGKKIEVKKVSKITDMLVKTSSVIEKDMIYEVAEISAEKPVKINFLYFFMHPWSTRFDKFHAVGNDGSKLDLTFKSDGSFPNRKFVPSASWYDTESGLGVATVIKNIKGQKKPQRFLWDRTNYRKDYLCDYAYSTLKPGTVVVYEAKTGFFQQNKSAEWIAAADELFKKLSE